jgi:hypothetical protein
MACATCEVRTVPDFQHGNDGVDRTLVVTQSPHFPTMHTRETATFLAAFGLDENQIAVILRCTPDDVRRHYSSEVEHGLMRINARVMSAVVHQALYNNDPQCMKLWLINKAGWKAGDGNRNTQAMQLNLNPDGSPARTGELTVVERREVITKLLVKATQNKRRDEQIIEAEIVPSKKTNGNGSNGANGNGVHK